MSLSPTRKFRSKAAYSIEDESDLTLLGYIAFLDPTKESAPSAIAALGSFGVAVKILTGDNEIITRKICREVGLKVDRIVLGSEIEQMSDQALSDIATQRQFSPSSPPLKRRASSQRCTRGHVVGFLGDCINDSPALRLPMWNLGRFRGRYRQRIRGHHPPGKKPDGASRRCR